MVADGESDLIGKEVASGEFEGESVGHFFDDELGFVIIVGLVEDLAGADAALFGAVIFDVGNLAGFVTPGVVDE